jgi:AI-2 transport protein TqsA
MTGRRRREQWMLITASLVVLAAIAIAFILWFTRGVMIPFVLAVFVVAVIAPLADFLETRLRFRRWMSVAVVLLLVLVVTAGFLLLLTYTAQQIGTSAASYATQLYEFATDWMDAKQPPAAGGEPVGDENTGLWSLFDPDWLQSQIEKVLKNVSDWLPIAAQQGLGTAVGIVSTFFLMIIFVLFLLSARDPSRLQLPEYAVIESSIRSYLATKTAISAVTGLLVGIILTMFGLELAIVFAVFAFLLNFIPSIGSIIATLIPLPIAYAQFVATAAEPNWWLVVAVLAIPGSIQMVIGNVLEPRIMGQGVGLHPIVILFALAFWGLLWGPVGAILAVPITAVVRIAISRFESFRMVTDLMAGKLPGQADESSDDPAVV